MKPHDIPVLKSIDRLGRNYEEILEQWRRITKEKNVEWNFIRRFSAFGGCYVVTAVIGERRNADSTAPVWGAVPPGALA